MSDPVAIAGARVEALLARLTHVNLQVVVVAAPDATRIDARDGARAAAIAGGRAALFDEASVAAREGTLRAFARAGFSGTWAATEMSVSIANASDRVAAAAAAEEAAMAAVVEDLIDDDTLGVLRATWNEIERSTGMPSPGSLAALATPAALSAGGPAQVAVVSALVILCAAIWVTAGAGPAVLALALGMAAIAALTRRRSEPRL